MLSKRILRAKLLHINTSDHSKIRSAKNHFKDIDSAVLWDVFCVAPISFEASKRKMGFAEYVLVIEGCVL